MERTIVDVITGETSIVPFTPEEEAEVLAAAAAYQPPVPSSISRPQAARQLLVMGLVTDAEALAMAQTGTPPGFVMTQINLLPAEQQIPAQIDFARYTYDRNNILLVSITAANGSSTEDVDNFFRAAAAL